MAEELFALEELIQVLTESNRKTLDLHSIIQIIEKLSTYVSEIKKVSLTLIKETAKLLVNLQLIDPIPEEIYLNVKEYVKSISSALIVPHVSHQNIESDLIGLMHEQLSSFKLDTSNPNAAISLEPLFIDTGAL